jgi:hypothetical protein
MQYSQGEYTGTLANPPGGWILGEADIELWHGGQERVTLRVTIQAPPPPPDP